MVHQVGHSGSGSVTDPRIDRPLGRRTVGRLGGAVAIAQLRVPQGRWRLERAAMSPSMALLTYQGNLTHFHVRDVLASVHVPTLVVHRKGEAIPSSTRAKSPRESHRRESSNSKASITGRRSATSSRSRARSRNSSPGSGRSTRPIGCWPPCCSPTSSIRPGTPPELGDRSWRELLARHDEVTHTEISRFQGRVVQHTGDGFLGDIRRPNACPSVRDNGRGADAGIGHRCALRSAHRRV